MKALITILLITFSTCLFSQIEIKAGFEHPFFSFNQSKIDGSCEMIIPANPNCFKGNYIIKSIGFVDYENIGVPNYYLLRQVFFEVAKVRKLKQVEIDLKKRSGGQLQYPIIYSIYASTSTVYTTLKIKR